ncbi:hypothetical protein, partial [Massilia glaciei]|uniref:hypothetical protein n=1 Tax=Massilia glaciei TaxID=1524097 RepID=UPI001C62C09E
VTFVRNTHQCSLTADSPNANRLRALAMDHLSYSKWWQKRLDILAKRDAWMAETHQQRME